MKMGGRLTKLLTMTKKKTIEKYVSLFFKEG
jgi:hypothetical protein